MDSFEFIVASGELVEAGVVSSCIKKELMKRNVDRSIVRRVSVASYEAEINIVIHSNGGTVRANFEDDRLEIVFTDIGPGIEDIDMALTRGFSTASEFARINGFGAGMGLLNIREVADEFYISSSDKGTILKVVFILSR